MDNQDEKIELIKRICELVYALMQDERKAIVTGAWGRLDAVIRRKSKLLKKLESSGLEVLDSLYIFDERIVSIRNTIQKIVNAENENSALLKVQMQEIKDNLSNLKTVLKTAIYGQPKMDAPQLLKHQRC